MDEFVDAYAVLGVSPTADPEALKAAYRRLAARTHPDRVPDDERAAATARMQQINVAYGLVADPARRRRYDQLRALHRERGSMGAAEDVWLQLLRSAGRWVGRQRRDTRGGWYRAGYTVGRWLRE
jgi:curved DNA-binding protein CbpA